MYSSAAVSFVDWSDQARAQLRGLQIDLDRFGLALIAETDLCVKLLDQEGRVVFINAAGCRNLELDAFGQLLGEPFVELWPEDSRSHLADALARAAVGEAVEFDAQCPTAKGRRLSWRVKVLPLDPRANAGASTLVISRPLGG